MWEQAVQSGALREALRGATSYSQRMLRLFGIPESEIAETLRVAEREGVELGRLEITTCLKRGEIEVVTRYEPDYEDTMTPSRELSASAMPTRCSQMTAARSTTRSPSCCSGRRSPRLSRAPAVCWRRA